MNQHNTDEYLLKAIAQVTGDDKLLETYCLQPGSKLDIKRTAEGGLEISIVNSAQTFWAVVLMLLVFGVGVFALIGWGLAHAYQWAFGPAPNVEVPFMLRSILCGIYVCFEIWRKVNVWNELARSYRIILVLFILLVFTIVLIFELLMGDFWGISWAGAMLGLTLKSIVNDP